MSAIIHRIFQSISDAVGVKWAPRNVSIARRLQTLAAAAWICMMLFAEAIAIFMFIKLLYSNYWWLAFLYIIYVLRDCDIRNQGGRTIEWVRNWTWWRYYCDYFPIKLIKTTDLDPSKNYLFACFPHGVICAGAYGAFATNALNFYKLFPGLTVHIIVLGGHFLVPFFREFALGLGSCSSSSESLLYLLDSKRHKGKCVALMVGGAAEALDSQPGEYRVVLSRRKGFIRIAMKSGASLVPVLQFGENEVFKQISVPENSYLRMFQEIFRKVTGISPIFLNGRGIFQYSYGLVPLRTPINIVIGAPMETKKNLDPTNDEVNAVHVEFTKRLVELFEKEKSKYVKNHENVQLIIS